MIDPLPLVSIVITSYNRKKTIAKAIESALAQDYQNLEIIISDNCSTDGSEEIIKQYTKDPRVHYSVNQTNIGMLENFKLAINEKSSGKYFSIVNSDDEYIGSSFISNSIELIKKYENVVLVKGASFHKRIRNGKYYSYRNNDEFEKGIDYFKKFTFNEDFGWAGVLIERSYIQRYKLLDSPVIGADYFINLQLALTGNIGFVKEMAYQFNIHDSNSSLQSYNLDQIDEIFIELRKLYKFALEQKALNEQEIEKVKANYDYAYIANIIEDYYKNNRSLLKEAENKLKDYNEKLLHKYYQSKRWKIFSLTFYNKRMGDFIVYKKWQLNNWLTVK